MEKGDIVVSNDPAYPLHCGSGIYSHAIVVQVDPLVLVSESTDMRWSTVMPDKLKVVGCAETAVLERCLRRLNG